MQYLNNKVEKLNSIADLVYTGIQINEQISVEKKDTLKNLGIKLLKS